MRKQYDGHIHIEGRKSFRGVPYAQVQVGDNEGFAPLMMIENDEKSARKLLSQQGVFLGSDWSKLRAEISHIKTDNAALIADRVGWNGGSFVLGEDEVIRTEGSDAPDVALGTSSTNFAESGTHDGWLAGVAEPLSGQSLPMLIFMTILAGPLLELVNRRDNFGFEIVGKPGCGKSTILDVSASIFGYPRVASFNATLDSLETELIAKNGLALMLDEANLFYGDEGAQKRGAKHKTMAFRLGKGDIKRRWAAENIEDRFWFTIVTSSNEMMRHVIRSESSDVVNAASDRLMSLRISRDRPFQTFDSVPDEHATAGKFAKSLEAAAREHHGHAIRIYLQGLVNDLAADRPATLARIAGHVDHWCSKVGIPGDDGALARVGEAFGLCYAAGQEAKRYGALPAGWRCGAAAETVYRDFYVGPKSPKPIDGDVRALAHHPGVRDLNEQGLRRMGDILFANTPAFKKRNRNGGHDLYIPPSQVERHLPGLLQRISSSRAGVRMLTERGHHKIKRRVRNLRTGKVRDRVVVLELPAGFL